MLLGELATIKKYDLNVKVIVIKNNTLGQIKWEQMVFLGHPGICLRTGTDRFRDRRARLRRRFAIRSPIRPSVATRFTAPLSERGAAVIEAVVDPHEPPLPPKISPTQAMHFAEALAKGTPHAGKIALTVGYDQVRELV